jgi:DNA mismatch endonuclease, patch repair protein
MAASPAFELFEVFCVELSATTPQVISPDRVGAALLEDLKDHFGEPAEAAAFSAALDAIDVHFAERGGAVPYIADRATMEFTATDADYLDFIAFAKNHRSSGGQNSKAFEARTLQRLRRRLNGDLRRVGVPRDRMKRKAEIVPYLQALGFDSNCLDKRDQDGGLDILWLPPLGAIPLRPIVSVQCKNSYFDEAEANASTGRAERTLLRHSHIRSGHMKFVVFNDYIDRESYMGRAVGWTFMPLGLTDLADIATPGIDDIQRSANMRVIVGRGNKTTERRLRALMASAHVRGWRLHVQDVAFNPDIWFPLQQLAIFVDGCFWHGCPDCGHIPKTNTAYWNAKIARNRRRDALARRALNRAGISVLRVWECALRRHPERCVARVKGALKRRGASPVLCLAPGRRNT